MLKSHPIFEHRRIFAPGPTPVPEEVLGELARAPLHHRTKEFIGLFDRVRQRLQFVFQTTQPTYLLSSSGTGAMETCIVNLFSTGDEILVLNAGKFGERWEKIGTCYGMKVHSLKFEWGQAADPEGVRGFLRAHGNIRGVFFQASETSTGVAHPVEAIAKVVRAESDALVIVDAITALGVSDLPLDRWDLDAVVSGSQKAFMLPPGLAFLALSARAHDRRKIAGVPRFYFDLNAEDRALAGGESAWTPAVGLIMALDRVLAGMEAAGLPAIFAHHKRLAEGTRRGVSAMGLELFAKKNPSDAVTAIHVPAGVEGKKIVSHLRDTFGITIAGGQDQWKGKMFRLAHLGFFDSLDMLTVLGAVEMTLKALGHPIHLGKGVAAAQTFFLEENT
ncbi:MAG: alanine--glyoxylate aminotransferase family protein [Deltaproteobacteria bacterium]|nr:alanine--glyoxylate aminotransferase family protein [Deltaproteobacteria bacterium]MBI3295263.1 alanine--glyoxylate aminotransferase family protein [Deltaproteobacteria bacterium]